MPITPEMAHPFTRAAVGAVAGALTLVALPGWALVSVAGLTGDRANTWLVTALGAAGIAITLVAIGSGAVVAARGEQLGRFGLAAGAVALWLVLALVASGAA